MSCISHLESSADGTKLPKGEIHTLHAQKPILVRYDLDAVAKKTSPDAWAKRPPTMWRYRELLPLEDQSKQVTLGETHTPLLSTPRLGAHLGLPNLAIKDESRLPGGSFKARGMAMAVSLAKQFGITRVATPTAGNAGGALAAYAARAGMECWVFMPDDTPIVNQYEAIRHGAHAYLVEGLIHDCGRIVREHADAMKWFDMSTLKEPYRIEGKKTMGLELAEQCAYDLPDAILYPTGGGTGLIGMWKAFGELRELGWLKTSTMPQMWSCQAEGCAPIAEGFAQGLDHGTEIANAHTEAAGIRVPKAVGDFLVLDAVRASGGKAEACSEASIQEYLSLAMRLEGIALCPESATCLAIAKAAVLRGDLDRDARVVIFNTGAAQKYVEVMRCELARTTPDSWSPTELST